MSSIKKGVDRLLHKGKADLREIQRLVAKENLRRYSARRRPFSPDDKCVACGSKYNLTRHHMKYSIGSFIILCRRCHDREHGRTGMKYERRK